MIKIELDNNTLVKIAGFGLLGLVFILGTWLARVIINSVM